MYQRLSCSAHRELTRDHFTHLSNFSAEMRHHLQTLQTVVAHEHEIVDGSASRPEVSVMI